MTKDTFELVTYHLTNIFTALVIGIGFAVNNGGKLSTRLSSLLIILGIMTTIFRYVEYTYGD